MKSRLKPTWATVEQCCCDEASTMTTTNRPLSSRGPAVEGDTIEEMLAGGADVDALIEAGELNGEWQSPAQIEADRQFYAAHAAEMLERSKNHTSAEIFF